MTFNSVSLLQLLSLWLARHRDIEILHPRVISSKQGGMIGMKPSQKPRANVNPD